MYLKEKHKLLDMKKSLFLLSLLLLISVFNSSAQKSFVVKKTGRGQPILLFPGFTCTSEVYVDLKNELVKNYELHAFTFAGFGGVPPISFPWLPQIKRKLNIM